MQDSADRQRAKKHAAPSQLHNSELLLGLSDHNSNFVFPFVCEQLVLDSKSFRRLNKNITTNFLILTVTVSRQSHCHQFTVNTQMKYSDAIVYKVTCDLLHASDFIRTCIAKTTEISGMFHTATDRMRHKRRSASVKHTPCSDPGMLTAS